MRRCSIGFVLALGTLAFAQPPAPAPPPPAKDVHEPVYKFYSTVFGTSVVKPGGLTGRVYALEPDTPRLPNFDRMRPVSKIWTTSLDIPLQDFTLGFPGVPERFEWFAIDYTGNIWIAKAGRYRFTLASDDGSALFIDNRLVIDNDGIHPIITKKGSTHLSAGLHQIRIAYFQGPRMQLALILMVGGPGEKLRVFDTDGFAPPSK